MGLEIQVDCTLGVQCCFYGKIVQILYKIKGAAKPECNQNLNFHQHVIMCVHIGAQVIGGTRQGFIF